MSRVGKQLIPIPNAVEVTLEAEKIRVKGPKGQLEQVLHPATAVEKQDANLQVLLRNPSDREASKFHGLTRSLINNMVQGVSNGFEKKLTLVGVGYRAALQGNHLNLTLGFSHPVKFPVPAGISIKVEKQTTVIISGVDKQQVGQVAANIRAFRKPEPYHGKGVRYSDERIVTKVGKAAGKK